MSSSRTKQPNQRLACATIALCMVALTSPAQTELVQNSYLRETETGKKSPLHFQLEGDCLWSNLAGSNETAVPGVAFESSNDLDGDGLHEARLSQVVKGINPEEANWYRFTIRALPQENFGVKDDDLYLRVEFYGEGGKSYLDSVTSKIYPILLQERKDFASNGIGKTGGSAVWRTYAYDFKLPFGSIDQLKLVAGFKQGAALASRQAAFLVSEFSLKAIRNPNGDVAADSHRHPNQPDASKLVPLSRQWYYLNDSGQVPPAASLMFTSKNADQLFFRVGSRWETPFADNADAWLHRGNLDLSGNLVTEDQLLPSVIVRFDGDTMIINSRDLPNHPTATFPGYLGNPNYIQEQRFTFYLPLTPRRNPEAVAMTAHNGNGALNMGPIGVAINGVVYFNPFDAGMEEAVDIMDRCCGHPSPGYEYHYHKYPVCVRSPFEDGGKAHSPLIGWAFDGFPIYGPYESSGVMAKDSQDNPLNEFNVHFDHDRGWHYHVTPGKFPYIIGGYWGVVDERNLRRGPPPGGGPGRGGQNQRRPG